jgi:hypothetical protein
MPEAAQGQGAPAAAQQVIEVEEDDNDPTTWKPERAAKTIETQRASEQAAIKAQRDATKRAEALEKQLKDIQDAGKSDAEKTTQRLADLEKQLEEERSTRTALVLTSDIKEALTKAGAINPALTARLIDRSGLDPKDGDYDRQINSRINDLKKEGAEFFKNTRSSADGGPRGKSQGGASNDMNALIRRGL